MQKVFHTGRLPLLTLGAGGLGFALRLWLYGTGVDNRGLLVEGHPAGILSFILTALFLGVLFLCVKNLKPQKKVALLFPASIPGAVGCAAGGVGALYAAFRGLNAYEGLLPAITLIIGILTAASFGYLAFCRLRHLKPQELFHAVVLVFLMLYAVEQYRFWSTMPQLQDYFFRLLACIFLILHAFYRGCVSGKRSGQQWHVFCSQAAVFFCCMSLPGEGSLFFLAMGTWAATDLCNLKTTED